MAFDGSDLGCEPGFDSGVIGRATPAIGETLEG